MNKYQVTVWFKDKTIVVSAKNQSDAKKKAYKKLEHKKITSLIDKQATEVF